MPKKTSKTLRGNDLRQRLIEVADGMEMDLKAANRTYFDEELEKSEDILRRLYEILVLSLSRIKQRRRAAMGL